MSETPVEIGSDETPDPSEPLQDALIKFTGCIGSALDGICSYGLTIGDEYVPFDPDPEDECEDEEIACSQVWVRVTNVSTSSLDGWTGDCAVELVLGLEVGVLRCIEIPEDGEAPTASDVLVAAMQSMEDMNRIFCAAMNCGVTEEDPEGEVFSSISSGSWTPTGPLGGQYGGIWTFTVTI